MPRKCPFPIVLTTTEREALEGRARRYTLPYRNVVRAKMILLAAEGLENKEIAARLDLPRPKVSKWRQRFYRKRLAGLDDKPRGGRPSVFSPTRGRGG